MPAGGRKEHHRQEGAHNPTLPLASLPTWVVMQRNGAALRHGEHANCVALVLVNRHKGDAVALPPHEARQEATLLLGRATQRLPVQTQVLCRDAVCVRQQGREGLSSPRGG
jgi:hypothetical protein